jgi:hypothetical protein
MYKSFELIYEALIQTHGVIMLSVYTCLMLCLWLFYSLFHAFVIMLCVNVCFHVGCLKIERERE